MQPQEIISLDLLDILFADRNKSYGAYILRKGYNRRLSKALLITTMIVTIALTAYYSLGDSTKEQISGIIDRTIKLEDVDQRPPEAPVPPPPPPQPAPQVAMIKNLVPVIVKDNLADEKPLPTQKDLENSRIGNITQAGIDDPIIAPPEEVKKGIIAAPPRPDDDNTIHINVSIESTYPGGLNAWKRFLNKTFTYPSEAQSNEIQGTVVVRFVVDKTGNVSNIQAIVGPEELRGEAVRVIGKSGKWKPAIQNGHQVNSYKTQPIVFQLQNE